MIMDEIKDPRGMIGVRLEMDGTLITTSKTLVHNILRCVERAGLTIREIYLQPLQREHLRSQMMKKIMGLHLLI